MDIVLIGGGHAHVEVLRSALMTPVSGARLTLVTRDVATPYSGMIPGYLAGIYTRAETHVDLVPLASRAGVRLIHAAATGLDPEARQVRIDGRPPVRFDIASLDIGSIPATRSISGAAKRGLALKPVDLFLEGWKDVEAAARAATCPYHVTMVGGGAAGVEVTMALHRRLADHMVEAGCDPASLVFRIVTADAALLADHAAGTGRRLGRALAGAGIGICLNAPVVALEDGYVCLADGSDLKSDATILATGASPPAWIAGTGLEVDGEGFVRVDSSLRSTSHPFVLAAGDIASFAPRPLPRNGVHAVRQGPLLADNLRRLAEGREAVAYRPQRHTMALISTGDGHAVASRGPVTVSGRWVWRWKDRIDRKWMRRYRELPHMDETVAMRCGGCGAKVPSRVLERALARLDLPAAPGVLTGLDAADDAAVLAPVPGKVLVQTVDQFPAFVEDPWIFGRIAAVHALSDIHAMGAEPHAALALAGLAPGEAELMEEDLVHMLEGVLSVLRQEGCALVGGHTSESDRASLGLAVTGYAEESAIIRLSGLQPGDAILLTRPLGTGTLLAANMHGEAEGDWVEGALDAMQRSNGPAARLLAGAGARSMTDVTGFGLAGHLWEMARASAVTIEIGSVPAYAGAAELLARGRASTLHPGNVAAMLGVLDEHETDPLLFDPQTAGGLVAGLPGDKVEETIALLHQAGETGAALIGHVTASGTAALTLASGVQPSTDSGTNI
ncbi:MAG: selenide, water dikinase SelD [Alphaproteobacteria bacterium]|nr:selenide, water dikinase SelD [Alphaproteobacteria bacterium]